MKSFNEYNTQEIEAIADKFNNNEFVTQEELKLWYEYKQALQSALVTKKDWENRLEEEGREMSEMLAEIFQDAETKWAWIQTIKTYPLKEFCKYYLLSNNDGYGFNEDISVRCSMARRVLEGCTPVEEQLIRELLEESTIKLLNNYRDLTTPVTLRHWYYQYNPANNYVAFETASDDTSLYDEREHYVYIHSRCNEHRWGETYWISTDCDNTLQSLPVIKDFKEYDFKIGGFYKIRCVNTIYYGGNKKKYVMEIEESTEEEFMTKGLKQYATRW